MSTTQLEEINIPEGCTLEVESPLGSRKFSGPLVARITLDQAEPSERAFHGATMRRRGAKVEFDWPVLPADRQAILDALYRAKKGGARVCALLLTGQRWPRRKLAELAQCDRTTVIRACEDLVLAGCNIEEDDASIQLVSVGKAEEAQAVRDQRIPRSVRKAAAS